MCYRSRVWLTRFALAVCVVPGCATPERDAVRAPSKPMARPFTPPVNRVLAVRSGEDALDGDKRGRPGNPFATALIELLGTEDLQLREWPERLRRKTRALSAGVMQPDWQGEQLDASWTPGRSAPQERRVAFVVVYSTYRHADWPTLPGAARDARRIGEAFEAAGFETSVFVDPSLDQWMALRRRVRSDSRGADAAVLYSTGHGLQVDGNVVLVRGDAPGRGAVRYPNAYLVRVTEMATWLAARSINLVFFGGCRTRYAVRPASGGLRRLRR